MILKYKWNIGNWNWINFLVKKIFFIIFLIEKKYYFFKEQRTKEESDLENYFESRMIFMDHLRTLIEKIPRRKNKLKKRKKIKIGGDNDNKEVINEEILRKEEEDLKEEEEFKSQQKAAIEHLRNRFRYKINFLFYKFQVLDF
jgi:hypothetical protein